MSNHTNAKFALLTLWESPVFNSEGEAVSGYLDESEDLLSEAIDLIDQWCPGNTVWLERARKAVK